MYPHKLLQLDANFSLSIFFLYFLFMFTHLCLGTPGGRLLHAERLFVAKEINEGCAQPSAKLSLCVSSYIDLTNSTIAAATRSENNKMRY